MRMVARKPVRSSTVTQELIMLNQWICKYMTVDIRTVEIQSQRLKHVYEVGV